MKIVTYKLPVPLLIALFSIPLFATPQLNGLASHQDLGKERFIAALYTDKLTSNPEELLNPKQQRRMELRVTANRYSSRKLISMWIEGMAINNSGPALTENAENMAKFSNMIKRKLLEGDILSIESLPGEGTLVSVNGVELGSIKSDDFFSMLMLTWIGSVPLSSDFRDALLQAGKIDEKLFTRFKTTTPTSDRVATVKSWVAPPQGKPTVKPPAALPTSTPPAKESQPAAAAQSVDSPSVDSQPVDSPSVAAPSKPTPPPQPQNAKEKQIAKASVPSTSESSQQLTTKPVAENSEPTTPKPVQVALLDVFPSKREILEEEDDEDLSLFTAESVLSRQLYHSKLLKWTYQHLRYPKRAHQRGHEGSVRLSVVIDRKGNIQNVSLVEESRYASFNKEARGAVNRADPFPPMPENMGGDSFSFSLPIVFEIY